MYVHNGLKQEDAGAPFASAIDSIRVGNLSGS